MELPKNVWLRCALLFLSQLLSFFIIAASFRALSKGLYFWTAFTDLLLALQTSVMGKITVEDKNSRDWPSIIAITLGGACGSLLSIYVTTKMFGG